MRNTIHVLRYPVFLLATMTLGACAMQPAPSRVDQSEPTVSYQYDGSDDQLDQASDDADEYCMERYGVSADLVDTDPAPDSVSPGPRPTESSDAYDYRESYGTGMVATFECG